MKLSTADIQKIADLARLEFAPEAMEKFSDQLSSILTYMEQLNRLDTTGIEPTSHMEASATPFREDRVVESAVIQDIRTQAPDCEGPFFKVPKVL